MSRFIPPESRPSSPYLAPWVSRLHGKTAQPLLDCLCPGTQGFTITEWRGSSQEPGTRCHGSLAGGPPAAQAREVQARTLLGLRIPWAFEYTVEVDGAFAPIFYSSLKEDIKSTLSCRAYGAEHLCNLSSTVLGLLALHLSLSH